MPMQEEDDGAAEPGTTSMWSHMTLSSQTEQVWSMLYVRALLSIYGGITFWVGGWDLCLEFQGLPSIGKLGATILFFVVGFAMTIATDTLYVNGAIVAHWQTPAAVGPGARRKMVARTLFGLIGTLFLWVGIFNCMNYFLVLDSGKEYEAGSVFNIDICVDIPRNASLDTLGNMSLPSNITGPAIAAKKHRRCRGAQIWEWIAKDLVCLLGGIGLMFATGTYFVMAWVEVEGRECDNESKADHTSSWQTHLKVGALSFVSVVGQAGMWLGAWDFLEYYQATTLWREIAYVMMGLVGYFAQRKFMSTASISVTGEVEELPQPLTFVLILRAAFGLSAGLVHITGFWTLIDTHLVPWSVCQGVCYTWRNILYSLAGLSALAVSGTLHHHACVAPTHVVPWTSKDDAAATQKEIDKEILMAEEIDEQRVRSNTRTRAASLSSRRRAASLPASSKAAGVHTELAPL